MRLTEALLRPKRKCESFLNLQKFFFLNLSQYFPPQIHPLGLLGVNRVQAKNP